MLTVHQQPWGAGLAQEELTGRYPREGPGYAQYFTVDHRELPSPSSVLFRVPKWSHIRDGQTEAWRGTGTCSGSHWAGGGGAWDQSWVSCVRLATCPVPAAPLGWDRGWGWGENWRDPQGRPASSGWPPPSLVLAGPRDLRVDTEPGGRELQGWDTCGKGVATPLQQWDPQAPPGSPFSCLNLHS